MHASAMRHGKKFFSDYGPFARVVEVGSMIVAGGSLREAAPANCEYIGIDCSAGLGVDLVMPDPYTIPHELKSSPIDAVLATSTFEHVEFFWHLFVDMAWAVRPGGMIYVNSPSNGYVHRHPVDCWRFYPDAGAALTRWAKRCGYELELVETYIGAPDEDVARWEDWVAIWRRVG
jgi:hypothetical protein